MSPGVARNKLSILEQLRYSLPITLHYTDVTKMLAYKHSNEDANGIMSIYVPMYVYKAFK